MIQNPIAVIRYQYDNHLGSASLELDNTGNIISYEEYHPFGTTSYRSGKTETETSQKRYKYVGKERDEETGLYYYGFRHYAAWLCRLVSVDPLQFDYPYYTPFQYAGNKPITYIDLDGLEEAEVNNLPEKKNSGVNLKEVALKSVAGETDDIGKLMMKFSDAKVDRMLSEGYLKASNGKIYKTTRMKASFVENLEGLPVKQVNRGVNFGFKLNGEIVTTKGVEFSTKFTKITEYGGKILAEVGSVFSFADLLYSFYSGGNPVSSINPIGFVMDDYLNKLDDELRSYEETFLSEALDKGYDATVDFLKSNYSIDKRYDLMDINQETLNMIAEGKITDYNGLLDASYNTDGDDEYSILYSVADNGNLQVRAGFLKPKD